MNSLLKSKPKSNTKKVVLITLICCAAGLCVQYAFPRFFISTAQMVAKPLWAVRSGTSSSVSGFFGYFARVKTLEAENQKLKDQLLQVRVKEVEYDQMKYDYTDLKALVKATSSAPSLVGRVISKPPFTPYDMFVIDKGTDEKVSVGDLVFANDALVIGTISQVFAKTSTVTLFSSGGTSHELILSRTHTSVEVFGKGGGNFELSLPKDFDVVVGDTFVEPSSDGAVVAVVYAVDQTSQNSFKKVYARVPEALFQSTFVIIKK